MEHVAEVEWLKNSLMQSTTVIEMEDFTVTIFTASS